MWGPPVPHRRYPVRFSPRRLCASKGPLCAHFDGTPPRKSLRVASSFRAASRAAIQGARWGSGLLRFARNDERLYQKRSCSRPPVCAGATGRNVGFAGAPGPSIGDGAAGAPPCGAWGHACLVANGPSAGSRFGTLGLALGAKAWRKVGSLSPAAMRGESPGTHPSSR
jgi:hypothetical protein